VLAWRDESIDERLVIAGDLCFSAVILSSNCSVISGPRIIDVMIGLDSQSAKMRVLPGSR